MKPYKTCGHCGRCGHCGLCGPWRNGIGGCVMTCGNKLLQGLVRWLRSGAALLAMRNSVDEILVRPLNGLCQHHVQDWKNTLAFKLQFIHIYIYMLYIFDILVYSCQSVYPSIHPSICLPKHLRRDWMLHWLDWFKGKFTGNHRFSC